VGRGAAVPSTWRVQMEGDELEYKHANTAAAAPDLVNRVIEQFRAAGCRAR
jgi:hypothetical protein